MKKYLTIMLLGFAFVSCKKESTPTAALNERVDPLISTAKASGGFNNGPYGSVTGTAKVYLTDGKYQLAFENFSTSNGPDLKVYLSKETEPVNFVNLGSLKSVSGNQLYDVPSSVNTADYKYALVVCQQYKHLFGYSELKN